MMRRLEQSHDNIIGYSVSGDVTEDDYTLAASQLRDAIAQHGSIRVLFRLSDMSMSSFFTAMDERMRFLKDHGDDIERIAIVTDDTATGMLSRVGQAITPAETETFSPEEESKAWSWLE